MNKHILLTAIMASAFALMVCGEKAETYTTDFLLENDEIRMQVLADCTENKQSDINCKNANEAENRQKAIEFNKQANH